MKTGFENLIENREMRKDMMQIPIRNSDKVRNQCNRCCLRNWFWLKKETKDYAEESTEELSGS